VTLASGTRLGAYEIVGSLGAGGMGEVYRALDTRLHRTVAIKVLAFDARTDPERRRRFQREAQAVAALSHPHIGGLHDIGEHEGTDFLVLELVEGQTLAARLAEKPLSVPEALTYGEQIAQALDHAHRHAIVHRDLKPQNVMITKTGAKLLDFGLARLAKPAVDVAGPGPTGPATLTAEGTLLGTLPYMAPEQLEGREADARADIFAFGAVLYEMIAGRRAFGGTSPASIIGAVLRDEPPPLRERQVLTPPGLERVVRRCLQKDPERRFGCAHDVGLELHAIATDPQAGLAAPAAAPATRQRVAIASVVIVLAILIGIAIGSRFSVDRAVEQVPVRFQVTAPAGWRIVNPVLSPDGRHMVLASQGEARSLLSVRALDSEIVRELPGTAGATYPFWSPDSQAIAFFADGKLKRVDVAGGTPIVICDAANPRGGTWNQDGVIIFSPSPISPLLRVSASAGVTATLAPLSAPPETSHRWPHFLPDGDHYLYFAFAAEDAKGSALRVASLSKPGAPVLVQGATAGWYADGLLFFQRDDVLLAQPFDPDRRVLQGEPRAVVSNPEPLATGNYCFSVSRSGTLAYHVGPASRGVTARLTWHARNGTTLGTIGDTGNYTFPAIAPDQNRVTVTRLEDGAGDIFAFEGPEWTAARLTTNPLLDFAPVWSPDGRRIAYASVNIRGAGANLVLVPYEGAAARTVAHADRFQLSPGGWAADGRIVFQLFDSRGLWSLWTKVADGREAAVAFKNDAFNYGHATLSPDGRWIAYVSDVSGRFEVYIDSFPTPGRQRPVPGSVGGREPRWRHDGRELYFVSDDSRLMAVAVTVPGQASEPQPLFPVRLPNSAGPRLGIRQYDVARDGRFLAVVVEKEAPVVTPLVTVSLNATAALRRAGK
jgi:eukaryotic-like serine/threonine-protein kinase